MGVVQVVGGARVVGLAGVAFQQVDGEVGGGEGGLALGGALGEV